VVTVLALAAALGLRDAGPPPEDAQVLLVELPQVRTGLLVDEVLGVQRLARDRLDRALSGSDFVAGIAEAHTVFLDLERLLGSGRFDVFEEVT
jgi:chemotaxis signal transduction protein